MYLFRLVLLFSVVGLFVSADLSAADTDNAAFTDADDADYTSEMCPSNTYDYIVIGAGQAGSVAATRLAEGGKTVLLIEGGGPSQRVLGGRDYVASDLSLNPDGTVDIHEPWTRFDVPLFAPTIYYPPTHYPDYPMYFNGFPFRSFVAKVVGGAGVHNGMVYLRFTKQTINSWGIDGWSYDDMLTYYKKAENISESPRSQAFPAYHGFNGPIGLSDSPQNQYYAAVPAWIKACNESGIPENRDYNAATRYGCGTQTWNIKRGVRSSAAAAYLPRVLGSPNFFLEINSLVTKILIKKGSTYNSKPIAYGVQYVKNNQTKRVFATKEVIVSASAIFTPKILLLSGIGDAATLTNLGIKVWVNSPNVGRGLQSNHFGSGLWTFPSAIYPNGLDVADTATEYGLYGTGPWSWTAQFGDGYACTKNGTVQNGQAACGNNPNTYVGGAVGNYTLLTTVSTATPKVRGNVTISTKDPFAPPNVTIDNYQYQEDLDAMVAGYKLLRKIFSTPTGHAVFPQELIPGPSYATDAQLAAYVRANTAAVAHWVASVRMGNYNDTTAVLDPKLKVKGIQGLRVADCSIFPSTNTHTAASAVVAGERVAAFILSGN